MVISVSLGEFTREYGRVRFLVVLAHRNAQCVAIALTAFSAYIITTARGWEKPWGPHGKYGLLVIALGFAQGYMGFVASGSRINFQRWHRTLGVATTVLAIRNCIIGAGMIQLFESHDVTSPASGFPRVVNLSSSYSR